MFAGLVLGQCHECGIEIVECCAGPVSSEAEVCGDKRCDVTDPVAEVLRGTRSHVL